MENNFTIPVTFNGKELELPTRLLDYGYSSKLEVDIGGTKIIFEPDEERNWRALVFYEDLIANKKINKEFLQAIAEVITGIIRQ